MQRVTNERTILSRLLVVSALSAGLGSAACTANIHDNTVNITDPKLTFSTSADTTNITPGQAVPVTMAAQNIFLVDPAATPPAEHVNDAGYFQIYLDDESTTPILITALVNVSVTIPPATKAGSHKLICRIHKHDGTATAAVQEFSFAVKVTASVDAG